MNIVIWFVVGLIIIGGAGYLVILGLREEKREDPLQERLAEYSSRGEKLSIEEIELSQPFSERIFFPLARRIGKFAARFTPQNAIQSTNEKLELAGNPAWLDSTLYWALRFISGIALGGLLLLVFSIGAGNWRWSHKLGIAAVFTVLGYFVPVLWLQGRINQRQSEVRRGMPDALDLLSICVEAGLGFDLAMLKVNEKWDNELSMEFGRVLREIQLGKARRDALRAMARRVGVPEMTSFVAAVVQSEQLGVSMTKVLRIQADQMRVNRRQYAEEEAQKVPVKMLVPLAFLIFPSICIILMAPAILQLLRSEFFSTFF